MHARGDSQSLDVWQDSLSSPRCGPAGPVPPSPPSTNPPSTLGPTAPTRQTFCSQTSGDLQSNVRVHVSPRLLVPPPLFKLLVVLQPATAAPTRATAPAIEIKIRPTIF